MRERAGSERAGTSGARERACRDAVSLFSLPTHSVAKGAPLGPFVDGVGLHHQATALLWKREKREGVRAARQRRGATPTANAFLFFFFFVGLSTTPRTVQMRSPAAWSSTKSAPEQSGQVREYLRRVESCMSCDKREKGG